MPWLIQKNESGQFCVHRKNDDGTLGALIPGGCHEDESGAERHLRALYANVAEMSYSESLQDSPHHDESMLEQTPPCIDDLVKAFKAEGMDDATAMARAVEQCRAQETLAEMSTNGGQDEESLELVSELGMMTQMRRGFPEIPFVEGVTLESIKAADPSPTFITLQIAEVGRKSKKGLLYDEFLVSEMESQIKSKRPGGIFGHPKPEEADYAFPEPAALWVGAIRQGKTLWGKAWVREPKAARMVRDVGLVGGHLGTSIWGQALNELKDGVVRAKKFILERIDFAPVERAALPGTGEWALTAEMFGGTEDNKPVTPEELKAELANYEPDVIINILPPATYERVSEMVAQRNSVLAQAGEQDLIRQLTAENQTANALIAEMQTTQKTSGETISKLQSELLQHDLDATVRWATDWTVSNDDNRKKLGALRSYLKKGLIAEMKADEPLKEAMSRVMDSQEFKPVIEMTKNAIGGGALVGVSDSTRQSEQFARPTEDQIEDARRRTGIR